MATSMTQTNYPESTWRCIISPPAAGSWNMALDEALLESVGIHNNTAALRLYTWQPGCISLGYAQPIGDIDETNRLSIGWDIVRRPTGGRAVLHIDELTYSVIAPKDEPRVHGSIIESYRRLSIALLTALHRLGLNANADKEYAMPNGSQKNTPVCFEVPSNYEITVDGKKLIGSAQARKHKAVLQHGSLPLIGDVTRILEVMHFINQQEKELARQKLLDHATTLEKCLGRQISFLTAANTFQSAFAETLNLNFILTQPTKEEMNRAYELEKEKYNHAEWTARK